jgi:hypothetical protein
LHGVCTRRPARQRLVIDELIGCLRPDSRVIRAVTVVRRVAVY